MCTCLAVYLSFYSFGVGQSVLTEFIPGDCLDSITIPYMSYVSSLPSTDAPTSLCYLSAVSLRHNGAKFCNDRYGYSLILRGNADQVKRQIFVTFLPVPWHSLCFVLATFGLEELTISFMILGYKIKPSTFDRVSYLC